MANEPATTPSSSSSSNVWAKSRGSIGALLATFSTFTLRVSSPSMSDSTPVVETLPLAT
ncbi:hypothetical protein D3C72_578500 [compost metagenome]